MDNIYLKIPSELDEDNYYNYINEFKEIGNDNTVFCIPAQNKYKRWLKMVRLASRKSVINDGQIYLYFLMEND